MKPLTRPLQNLHRPRSAWWLAVLAALVYVSSPSSSWAGRRTRKPGRTSPVARDAGKANSMSSQHPRKLGEFNPADETVELFDALEAGKIAVKLIPKDSTEGRLFIKNKSGKPLNVKLPDAFAASPILAQGMGGGMMGGGGGGGQGMGGGGMGMMNVPAEKELNARLPCVCLEHGKPEPRPKMTYQVKRVDSFTDKPGISELLKRLGHGETSQRAAQAAAWHMNNGMSWEELAQESIDYLDGTSVPFFTADELRQGMAEARQALSEARGASPSKPSPGETAQRAD